MKLTRILVCYVVAVGLLLCLAQRAECQHQLLRGDMPPGEVAHKRIIGNPQLTQAVQPVRVVTPLGASVSVYSLQGFFDTGINTATVGLRIGPVYRLRISNIAGHQGKEVYPSIELIDRLYPPEGLASQFPIEVVISADDLKRAISGRMVTKVVYLEDPKTALPYQKVKGEQPTFDIRPGQDPLSVSRRLGRPMAIVRIGSRIPLFSDKPGEFEFDSPEVQLLPDVEPQENRNQQYDSFDNLENQSSIQTDLLPPSNASPLPKPAGSKTQLPKATAIENSISGTSMPERLPGVNTATFVEPKIPPPLPPKDDYINRGIVRIAKDNTFVIGDVVAPTNRDAFGPAAGKPIIRDPYLGVKPIKIPENAFQGRGAEQDLENQCLPVPISRGLMPRINVVSQPQLQQDEFVFDGGDRDRRITVDQSWNVYGMETEDTFAHFDTLDRRRLVSPSNRVSIYSPRFGAVRHLPPLSNQMAIQSMRAANDKLQMQLAKGKDFSSTAKQNESVQRNRATQRANSFRDRTRSLRAETTVRIGGFRNVFQAYENLSLIRYGRFSQAEGARLGLAIESAKVWQDEAGLQVTVNKAQPIVVRDVNQVQEIQMVESKGDNAVLRVVKLASRIAAKSGDTVEFTIRYDNLGRNPVGNVTLIDNLSPRLQYIDGSTQSSLEANFVSKRNDAGSLTLRWEIIKPVPGGKGGIIRFKCRVR